MRQELLAEIPVFDCWPGKDTPHDAHSTNSPGVCGVFEHLVTQDSLNKAVDSERLGERIPRDQGVFLQFTYCIVEFVRTACELFERSSELDFSQRDELFRDFLRSEKGTEAQEVSSSRT